jgi:serine/threonine protein kinase
MPVPTSLLQAIGVAALPIMTGGASSLVEMGSGIASKVWEWWSKRKEEKERRAELEALAQATFSELRTTVHEVVEALSVKQPGADTARLESYLLAVPAQVRRTLRRPSDASGRTIPAELPLARMEDLVPLLPPRPPRFVSGDRVADFELIELLGVGGFGEVWKARNSFMPGAPRVALKFCIDAQAAASLRRETLLLDKIQREGKHSGIVQLQHTFLSAEPPFLEYELVEGGDLGGLIVEWHRKKGGPTPKDAARVVHRLAEIVAFAHARGITHRDLKPANILVQCAPGTSTFIFKIADFGIGSISVETANRAAGKTGSTGTRTAASACGGYSLYYASPEQARGTAKADPRDDVHALGVIWYQLLAGDLTAEAPRGPGWKKRFAAQGMSAELIELMEACTASERGDRPASGSEVAEQIGRLLKLAPPPLVPEEIEQEEPVKRPGKGPSSSGERNPDGQRKPTSTQPKPVLPRTTLDKVADSVAEGLQELGEEKRRTRFLDKLQTIRDALIQMESKATWWKVARIVFLALAASSLAGVLSAHAFETYHWSGDYSYYTLNVEAGFATFFLTFVPLMFGIFWFRRYRLRRRVDGAIHDLRTDYRVEMGRFRDLDFRDPDVVAKVMKEFKRHLAPKPRS